MFNIVTHGSQHGVSFALVISVDDYAEKNSKRLEYGQSRINGIVWIVSINTVRKVRNFNAVVM